MTIRGVLLAIAILVSLGLIAGCIMDSQTNHSTVEDEPGNDTEEKVEIHDDTNETSHEQVKPEISLSGPRDVHAGEALVISIKNTGIIEIEEIRVGGIINETRTGLVEGDQISLCTSIKGLGLWNITANARAVNGQTCSDNLTIRATSPISIRVSGSTDVPANVTTPEGFQLRIIKSSGVNFKNLMIRIILPEGIHLSGTVDGRPLILEKTEHDWKYRFETNLTGHTFRDYEFTYKPEIFLSDLEPSGSYRFQILVEAFDDSGVLLAEENEFWTVTRP